MHHWFVKSKLAYTETYNMHIANYITKLHVIYMACLEQKFHRQIAKNQKILTRKLCDTSQHMLKVGKVVT